MNRAAQVDQLPTILIVKWFLMAFIAGNVNAGGYLACHRFVTHVTGFATLFGIELVGTSFVGAIGMLSVPFYFLLGVMVSAYLTDRKISRGHPPRYDLVMGIVALLLVAAALGGYFNVFGTFGNAFRLKSDYFLLVILCAASGLQNAAITTASGSVMRSTHLTGTMTDLGIGLVRALFGKKSGTRRQELYRSWLRSGIVLSFAVGGVSGALMFTQVQYLGFLLPAVIAVYVGNLGVRAVAGAEAPVPAAKGGGHVPPDDKAS